ncbi:molybdopterin-binding protein [Desulfovibrio sp. OttesenSCG-928-A18]|nr:molybdopterin-binding protein [Desulfovibrio sp. OttesenSCG-928-A18]
MTKTASIKCIPVTEAVGLTLCHDITEIIPGKSKGSAFLRGHIVREEDVEHLLRLGKEHLYVWEGELPEMRGQVHEDDAARRMAKAFAGPGVSYGDPREGRINFKASYQGLFQIHLDLLDSVNSIPHVTVATAHSLQGVAAGDTLAGTRVIPLSVPEDTVAAVEECCAGATSPLLRVLPFRQCRVGIVTTGSEVYSGRIKDGFGPVLSAKFAAWGSEILGQEIVPDETDRTAGAILKLIDMGADIVCVTGGMSVDPDDKTPAAIRAVGCDVVTYGAPVFPGAMFMLGYRGRVPVLGLPGCVMYHKGSIFDLIMPRILAGLRVCARDISKLAHGGLCKSCPQCTFPNCAFGKG